MSGAVGVCCVEDLGCYVVALVDRGQWCSEERREGEKGPLIYTLPTTLS